MPNTATHIYRNPAVSYSTGKLTKVAVSRRTVNEDRVPEYDLMQRGKKNRKTISSSSAIFEGTFDNAERAINTKYLVLCFSEKFHYS